MKIETEDFDAEEEEKQTDVKKNPSNFKEEVKRRRKQKKAKTLAEESKSSIAAPKTKRRKLQKEEEDEEEEEEKEDAAYRGRGGDHKKKGKTDEFSTADTADVEGGKATSEIVEAKKKEGEALKRNAEKTKKVVATKKKIQKKEENEEEDENFLQIQFDRHRLLSLKHKKFVGAHVSMGGGIENAAHNCFKIGGQSFSFFLKNQRTFTFKEIEEENIDKFTKACALHTFSASEYIMPHGSYLVNLGNPSEEVRRRSYILFVDDLKRCERLGIGLYNFHPGSTIGKCSLEESIDFIAENINIALKETTRVCIVIENMSGQGNLVGSDFKDLKMIIEKVDDKKRIGVCLDTCHMFAAGMDIRTEEKFSEVMENFDKVVGLKYLRAIHLNDSKSPMGSKLDRHENIGKGKIGIDCFRFLMKSPLFVNIPIILETPDEQKDMKIWAKEIRMLYEMIDDEKEDEKKG